MPDVTRGNLCDAECHIIWAVQITTCKGIVMGRLHSTVRELEVDLMRFCFQKLGVSHPLIVTYFDECHTINRALIFRI